jgi:hypothetical protein
MLTGNAYLAWPPRPPARPSATRSPGRPRRGDRGPAAGFACRPQILNSGTHVAVTRVLPSGPSEKRYLASAASLKASEWVIRMT